MVGIFKEHSKGFLKGGREFEMKIWQTEKVC